MRKSFTLLFSTLMLLCAFGFSSFATAPVVTGKSPTGENVSPTTTDLVITFDQNVKFTSTGGTLTINKGGTLVKTVALATGNANATISGNKLTVKHGLTLEEGASYSIGITANAIENTGGEKYLGMPSSEWAIIIGDYTAPVVQTLNPANGATGVDVQADPFKLEITFQDANNINFVAGKKVWLYKADGTIVDIVTISASNTSVTGKVASVQINPNAYVGEYTQYYVNVEAGAFEDASPNNNKFAGIMNKTTWAFSSMDYSAAYVVSSSIDNITGSGGTLNVTLNEKGHVWYNVQLASASAPDLPPGAGWTSVATDDAGVMTAGISGLDDGVKYKVYLIAENLVGDKQSTATTLEFTTLDVTAPLSSNPVVVNENNVTVAVQLTFNEQVVAGAGDLQIRLQSNNAVERSIPATAVEIHKIGTTSNWLMTASFEGLESAVGYYVIIPDGFVTDVAGNDYVSTYVTSTAWMFTSSDFVAPTADVKIASGATPAATDNITIAFSEPVKLIGATTIESLAGLNQAAWFDYITLEKSNVPVNFTATYSSATNTITVDPASNLEANSTYVLKIRANAFEDLSGNDFSNTHKSYNLVTGDFGPATISITPADGATANQGTQPKITFSKVAKVAGTTPADITAANIKPFITFKRDGSGGANVAFTVTWDAATRAATLVPDAPLVSEGVYYVDFDHTKVVDVYGGAFTDPTASTFTMIDYIVPTVAFSHSGTVDDIGESVDLTLTFSEDVTLLGAVADLVVFKETNADGANLDFTASWDEATDKITINPDLDLVDGKVYYYGVGAGAATDGTNKNEAAFTSFTFAPAVPEMLEVAAGGYVPAINASNVKLNASSNLVASLTFTEAVKANPTMPAADEAKLYIEGNATPISTVSISASDVEGSKLTITFPAADVDPLVSEGKYYITVDADVVVANADNNKTFGGIAANVWKFTSADIVAPVLSVNTPVNGAAGVALNAPVVMDVTETNNISAGTGNILIKRGATTVETIPVGSAVIKNTAPKTITIPHAAFTHYETVYTVSVPAGAFKDVAGNLSNALEWSFSTVTNPPPAIVKLIPADDQDMVAAGTENFVIEFSEPVQKGPAGSTAYLLELSGNTRATLSGGVINTGTDVLRGSILVENATAVQVSGNVVTLNFGFPLVDGKEYYILVEDGMFKDMSLPDAANFAGLLDEYGEWNFFTKNIEAPKWAVSYTERGEGMDITSNIIITFDKPIEKNDGSEITNTDVASLFTLKVNNVNYLFTGNINAEKTIVVLENSSFTPLLTTANSGQEVKVAPTSNIRGKVNHAAVSTVEAVFNISDYVAPTASISNIHDITGDEFKFDISSNEAGTLYWVVQQGTGTLTAAEVKAAGTVITNYTTGPKAVVKTGLVSETKYTIYGVAEDKTGNISEVVTVEVTTADVTPPVLVSKTNVFDANNQVTLTFSEDVIPDGAVAVIRKADTHEIVSTTAPLSDVADSKDLKLTYDVSGYSDDQQFIIEIEGGQVKDLAGNAWAGQIGLGANAWLVSIPDRTAPQFVSITPDILSGALVGVNDNFKLTFNENVKLGSNPSFLIKYYDYTDSQLKVFELVEVSRVTVSGKDVTIDPSRSFAPRADGTISLPHRQYELYITAGSITDLAGNAYALPIQSTFNIVDNVAPTATFSPANGATSVLQGNDLTITFTEALLLADGTSIDKYDLESMVYLKKGGNAVAHTAIIDAAKKVITIDPVASLEKGGVYSYGFTSGFRDAAGNAVTAREVSFTVVTDAVLATYIIFDPDNKIADQRTIVPVDQEFKIKFTGELFTYSTVAAQNNIAVTPTYLQSAITLKQGATNVPFTVTIAQRDQDSTIVVVKPNANLLSETNYDLAVVSDKVQIGVGASPLTGKSNAYRTVDVSKPVPVANGFVPANGSTVAKATTMSITFNEPVKAGTGTVTIYHKFGTVVKTIDAATLTNGANANIIEMGTLSDLAADEYFVKVTEGAITDLAGNAWAGISIEDQWHFIVNDDLAQPVITDIAPEGGNTPVNTRLSISFDRPVVLNPDHVGYIAIYDADGIAFQLIRVNDGAANLSPNGDKTIYSVTINQLEESTQYFVEVSKGTFVAQADNSLENEGIVRSLWSFTTENNNPPMVVSLTPADNATNVNVRTVAKINFDIEVKPGTGSIQLRKGVDASIVHSFNVNSNEVVFDGNTVTFDLSPYLEGESTAYYIIVPQGAITNISSDPESFAGLEQTTSWNFTTRQDGIDPELVTWAPDDVEINNNHPVFTMEFSEDVALANEGNLVVTKVGANQPTLVIPLTESMISGSTVTVTYDEATIGALEFESEYFVTIAGNIIEDLSENPWAGVTDPTVWTFATKDRNVTIAEIQGTGSTSPMMDVEVRVTATVTGISMGEGFFMQDANAAWSGIWVEYGNAGSLAIGDGVVIIGDVTEISEVTTIVATEVQAVNAPVTVTPVVVASPTAVKAEMYESVLVQVLEAQASAANSAGVWNISYGTNDVVAVNRWMFSYTPEAGHIYDVTGIVNGRMSNYRMEPRRITDIIHYKPIADIQGTGPVSPVLNEVVHVMATVTAVSTGEGFFMQDANEAWSGIWVEYANAASLSIGDGVKVVGSVSEISEVTSIVATSVESIDAPIEVEPVVVNSPAAAKAEMFESVLVQVKGAKGTAATNGIWRIFYETADNVDINKWFYTYAPVADHFYDVTGVVNGRMSNYRLEPRMESDITDLTVNSIPEFSAVDFKVYPNPFSGHINIDNSDRLTRVVITNIAGQRILDVQYPERTINTSNLVNGVYVISLFNEDGMVKSHRIVKR